MPRIEVDLTQAICLSFEDPGWEPLRQYIVNAHQGNQPLTLAEAAQQMRDTWAWENQIKVDAWNHQVQQDLGKQNDHNRAAHEAQEAQAAQQEKEEEELHKEANKKKPSLNPFDSTHHVVKWIGARPVTYALNKLSNLEYVELDYFTPKSCKEASTNAYKSVSNDT